MSAESLPDPLYDPQVLTTLDSYVDALRAARVPDQEALKARHPDLAAAFACLEDLQRLAEDASGPLPHFPPRDSPEQMTTLPPPAGTSTPDHCLNHPGLHSDFGNYELLGLLGRGGMGVVYKARQKDLDRIVALKMILTSHLASDTEIRRFHSEAQAAASLRHPHVLQVYEAGQVLGHHYFAMQYVEGPSLAQRLHESPLPAEEAARCTLAVAQAVAYLHTRGIVHRDLKPSNILLDDQGWPYVTDFGLVKILAAGSDLTGSGAIVGTPSYMAPEQAAGRNTEVGPLSDVYSVGAILYEMLTGRPPFKEPTPFETLVQVLEGEPPLPHSLNPRLPHELEMICLKAMAKLPEQRYASAADLVADLERFLRSEPVLAQPQSSRQHLIRWARQEPGLVARLGVLAAGGAIAQVYYHLAHPVTLLLHAAIMGTLGFWALASIVCQTFIRRGHRPDTVRVAWLVIDALMLTTAMVMDEAFHSPLVLAYGVYIVASGLWFRMTLVWLTTALAVAGYVVLVGVGAARGDLGESPQHHLIVLICLMLLGLLVASEVKRVRALSRFYERRL